MNSKLCYLLTIVILTLVSCSNKLNPKNENIIKINQPIERPNIIWLMAEDMSLDLEVYGMPAVKTPNLNWMANNGVRFDNAFVTNSICSPSRSAMILGTHQNITNTQNHRSNRKIPLNSKFTPFTALLREKGYTTILGHHGVFKKGRKIDVNFKHKAIGEWDGKTKFGLFDKYDTFEKEDQPFFAQIQLDITHRGDWWNDIREQSEHPVDPDDVVLPDYYADHPTIRLDWAKYLDQIEYMDNEVGMIFKELEEKGMVDNTIVIFIGDNGRSNIKGKGYLHDPGLRIPFIVYYPNEFKGGRISKEIVSATDITASILDFAGVKIPDFMTGKPIFKDDFQREYVYATRDLWDEIPEKSRGITTDEWKYIRNDKPNIPYDAHQAYLEFYRPAVHIMRTLKSEGKLNEVQQFFFEDAKPKEELYNLKNDPFELNNLASNPKYKEKLNELRSLTAKTESEMQSDNPILEAVPVPGSAFIEWLKQEEPVEYKRMQSGIEIGYDRMIKKYNKFKKGNHSRPKVFKNRQ